MKKLLMCLALLMALFALASGVWMLNRANKPASATSGLGAATESLPPPTSTNTNATEVFQRAFWKRPTENDNILHAERREWADGDGVDRWQWFIAVDPSVELARYLHEQNPFSMSSPKAAVVLPKDQLPEWFPTSPEDYTVQQTADGQMTFLVDPESGRLFATSQGRGFAKAVEMPAAAPATSAPPQGRLPTTRPPTPKSK